MALKVKTLDPRIHAAVTCAAMSCPRLRESAYRPETVEATLAENMREFLASESQFSKSGVDKLKANQIVFWYFDDFETAGKSEGNGAGTWLAKFLSPDARDRDWKAKHLKDHLDGGKPASIKASGAFEFLYDWRVNDVGNKG